MIMTHLIDIMIMRASACARRHAHAYAYVIITKQSRSLDVLLTAPNMYRCDWLEIS